MTAMMATKDEVLRQTTRIIYRGRGRELFYWYVETLIFSIFTLGLYLPVAANKLLRLLTQRTVICWYDFTPSEEEE
jgi:uncharacterized membrane protein YjgN (DUF898 family)